MLSHTQMPDSLRAVIDAQMAVCDRPTSVTVTNTIPDSSQIPTNTKDGKSHWLRIPEVICVFVDMIGSTRLSATHDDRTTAKAYQLFTETAVRLFHECEAAYIDVKGDGAFALFDAGQAHRALAAAVTVKTFAKNVFQPKIRELVDEDVGLHCGIDRKTLLVRKLGLQPRRGRSDRQNEVWAGRPVNMAAKLAALSKDQEVFVSDRFFRQLKHRAATQSCGCPMGHREDLWEAVDLTWEDKFDFDTAYVLRTTWCKTHGKEYCAALLDADGG